MGLVSCNAVGGQVSGTNGHQTIWLLFFLHGFHVVAAWEQMAAIIQMCGVPHGVGEHWVLVKKQMPGKLEHCVFYLQLIYFVLAARK